MKNYKQYINWFPKLKPNGKTDKIPVGGISPEQWISYDEAHARAQALGYGVGFVFTENDPYFFIDIDHALINGEWSPLALSILSAFPGCEVEVSYSGEGLHIFGRGSFPGHKNRATAYGLELYTAKRFVALTGTSTQGDPDTDGQTGLNWLVESFFTPQDPAGSADWTDEPVPEWAGPEDDDELIKRALRSKSAAATFGGKASFKDLFEGNVERLAECYPSADDPFDHSSADAALCSHLAFYTGKNCERIERIFTRSALGQRDKWAGREDYRQRTILGAVSVCGAVYNRPPAPDPIGAPDTPAVRASTQFLDLHGQIEYFKGCAYVIQKHRVFTPNNGLLKPDQFKATYGGYQFALQFEGKPTKSAFEAFTESQLYAFPKVYGTCFRPELEPGGIIWDEGLQYVNTYAPVNVDRVAGDPSRFLDLLARIIPDERDRVILLSYMAACVQHVGFKFQWAPLIQGTEGNGKTFLATAVSRAVGEKYSHFPNAADLAGNGSKFTGWLHEKLFIGIEEIFTDGKTELQEALKPLITNRKIEIQYKGMDQFTGDNRANFILFSNHKDAVKKTKTDRRYCIFYSAQQSKEDLINSGMSGRFFPEIYDWARDGGYAIITDYLFNYAIPEEFNPAGSCHRAPSTTSTSEALSLSLGVVEQEIAEAISEDRPGFRGGWVSSVALDNFLAEKRHRVALNKRRELLGSLGYVVKERMNTPSSIDGGKRPTLYAATMELINLPAGVPTAEAYENAQRSGVPAKLIRGAS